MLAQTDKNSVAVRTHASSGVSSLAGNRTGSPHTMSRPPPSAVRRVATVVVIDDSQTVLTTVGHWLEEDGHRVVPLTRALGATSTLLQVRPDVLLLDIQMPGLSGDRFARILSQSAATASIPIIFHSQIEPTELKRLAHECAVVGAIAKTSSRAAFMHEFDKLAAPFIHSASGDESLPRTLRDPVDTGVVEIDTQHRAIKRLSARIAELLIEAKQHEERASTKRSLRATALELLVYMRFHLATEDRYMREHNCAGIADHRSKHDAYLDEFSATEKALEIDSALSDLVECCRRVRLHALEHLWSTDPENFRK